MGNHFSINECVFLSQLPTEEYIELLQEEFTVERTDGRIQGGWKVSGITDINRYKTHAWVAANAIRENERLQGETFSYWKIFMVRYSPTDISTETHLWGWRPCFIEGPHKFWPTRLTGAEEKDAWRTSFCNKLNSLKIYGLLSKDERNRVHALQEKCDLAAKKAVEDANKEDLNLVNLYSQVSLDAIIEVIRSG